MVWEAPDKAVEKDGIILSVEMEIGSPFEAWRTLVKIAAGTHDAASDRAVKEE